MNRARDWVTRRRSRGADVLIGLVCAAVATGMREMITPYVGDTIPWATFFAFTLVAALLAGPVGGAMAIVASLVAAVYTIMSPRVALGHATQSDLFSIGTFMVVASSMVAVGARCRGLLREAVARSSELERLYAVGRRCAQPGSTLGACLDEILDAAMWITRASKGNIQLYDPRSDVLVIGAQRGFEAEFLDFFSRVTRDEAAACGAALAAGERVLVDDVAASPVFAGQPSLAVLRRAGVRAVQSTPLVATSGEMLGIVSTHFTEPRRWDERELRLLDLLARQAADYLERMRTEERERDATQQLHVVTGSMAAIVSRCSRDLTYRWVSKPYADWIQREPSDIVGKSIEEVLGARAFEQLAWRFKRVLSGQVVRYEEQVPFAGIGLRWIAGTYTPTYDAGGACDGWVAVVVDVTAQKMVEDALADANRRKDEFLAMLGHELRNPLAAVRAAVATASLQPRHRDEMLAIARRQTDQLARLIDDLLDVARINQGRIGLRLEPTGLPAVIRHAVAASRSFCDERGHTLDVDLPPRDVYVNGDATRLEQVLVNLLSNACKYTNPGGRIWVALEATDDHALIRVRDTGVGIAPDVLPRVFDLFAQADRSLDRTAGGLGIGLTVAQRIAELHGGRIEASSEGLGKGTTFVVRLPIMHAVELPAAPVVSAPVGDAQAVRVLIVEDNVDTAESLRLMLESLGHRVRLVGNGVEALSVAAAFQPDLMLVDIGLPGMSGYELVRQLRRDRALDGARMVALTGYGSDDDRRASGEAGFDRHLVKPADPCDIEALLHDVQASVAASPRDGLRDPDASDTGS